jgi:hypothetical protein
MRTLSLLLLMTLISVVSGDEKLKGIACRSVHLSYLAQESVVFYNEITVEKSAPGTYFMVAGWSKGYFGIQELDRKKKLVIFSVWDPTNEEDPKKVAEEKRVKLLHQHPKVRIGRFGNEGTGGQSFFDYDWKVGDTYRFCVTAKKAGDRTEYAGWFYHPEDKQWLHLVTFSTLAEGHLLDGLYSFIEDFKRNKVSTTLERRAQFGSGWIISNKGIGKSLIEAKFTADANPVLNIDAGIVKDRFFLATGGDLQNTTTKLKQKMTRPDSLKPELPPVN